MTCRGVVVAASKFGKAIWLYLADSGSLEGNLTSFIANSCILEVVFGLGLIRNLNLMVLYPWYEIQVFAIQTNKRLGADHL